jgi:hypothetical protein
LSSPHREFYKDQCATRENLLILRDERFCCGWRK